MKNTRKLNVTAPFVFLLLDPNETNHDKKVGDPVDGHDLFFLGIKTGHEVYVVKLWIIFSGIKSQSLAQR